MRKILRIAAIIYAVYISLFLILITPALNIVPHWFVEKNYNRQLETSWVLLNPFTLSLEIREAALTEPDGELFTRLGKASINLSLTSLWSQGWVFDVLQVGELYAHVIQKKDGTFNFSDLLTSDPEASDNDEKAGGIPGLTVHNFAIHSESILFTDESREKPVTSRWNGLNIHVEDLSTVLEDGRPYTLEVHGEEGGSLRWEGTISIPNALSEGHLVLSNLSMPTLWRLAEPWLEFEVADGRFALQGQYRFDWQEELIYQITEGQVGLSSVAIVPKNTGDLADTQLQLQQLDINAIAIDSIAQQVVIDTITVDTLAIAGWMEGSRISLQELFVGASSPDSDEAEMVDDTTDSEGWSATLNEAKLINSSFHWRSAFTDPALLEIQPVTASIQNLTWPLSGDTRLSLALAANQQASIALDGSLALAEGKGGINYTLEGLPLTWFNPNLPAALQARFTGGELGFAGQVALADFAPTRITLTGAITDFSAHRNNTDTMLTGWDTVRIDGLTVDLEDNNLVLERLAINHYKGRLHIAEDGSVNASNVWKAEVGDEASQMAEELSDDKPWRFDIPTILVSDSEIDFMDQSLPIPFRTVIGDLDGKILGLGSGSDAAAQVDFKGSVDGYAPVSLDGEFNPFLATPALDLELSFSGVDMALLSPYSGTYAGYAIDQGLLGLNLQYALLDNRLQGKNQLRIDQLKLGDKIESDKAVDVPLELALAIMTDAKGVIDMGVPVSGNVDDPDFALGGIIARAFINILTKAITAPFNLLANLVGSEEDLQRMTFASGSAELNPASMAKLDQLAGALAQRPGLSLTVTGRLNPDADRERLQKNALKAQIVDSGLSQEDVDSKGPAWEKAIARRYQSLPDKPGEGAEPTSRDQYLSVARSIAITDQQMLQLAEQRAVAVKAYLVNTAGMEANRAVVAQTALEDDANLFSGVALDIGN